MKISLICVGRSKGPLAKAIDEYERRVIHYFSFEVIVVREASSRGKNPVQVMEEEGDRILARVPAQHELIVLDRGGSSWSSQELADYLERAGMQRVPGVSFAIGGAFGLSRAVLDGATQRLSLSAMTLPHDMARLVLTEQLYRAGTITRGEPYHKGGGS